ncbi:hypothetical protein BDQ12DRAFT_725802 [Crucibulum laeve]|uniref:Uncharacterized protein n=1 Tax=Crucibulum laeve TaxID=68775 RepID=A0A5C3LSH0_9AGAR|nr:hypothetical protein BDQ12DRAFT_725802 [Crucibulum laeve]
MLGALLVGIDVEYVDLAVESGMLVMMKNVELIALVAVKGLMPGNVALSPSIIIFLSPAPPAQVVVKTTTAAGQLAVLLPLILAYPGAVRFSKSAVNRFISWSWQCF